MSMSFRGQPEARYYTGPRFEVPFHTVGSLRYEQTEQELMAYTMPITEIIRRNIVNDIQEIEDTVFLDHVEAACQSLQKDAQGIALGAQFLEAAAFSATNIKENDVPEVGKCKGEAALLTEEAVAGAGLVDPTAGSVVKDDFIKLFQLFTGNGNRGSRLRCDQFLITDTDFEDLNAMEQTAVGDKIVGENMVDGYKYSTVMGRKFIRTLKTDILRPGNIYAFAAPEFLGGFLILNKTKFYADKERNRVSFEAWEDIGMYIGNVAGCRKLELYAGSVDDTSGDNAKTKSDRAPKAEKDLGQKNNLVEEGGTHPSVSQF
jgi:hypothetical protein